MTIKPLGLEDNLDIKVCNKTPNGKQEKIYTYGEAINLAGDGWYSWGLLGALSVSTLAMAVDMFGFSVIVNAAACEFDLDIRQTSILLSMSFIGPIAMAYPWGYVSDTQGRRKSILIAMWVSFVVSTAGAFSPNWMVMAALKFISTSFCSCAHSASFTLLGESCAERSRDAYMLIMTSVLDFSLAFYVAVSYFILNMDFIFNWGFITFTPWRLLALGLALPLGLGALGTHFFYESPKFLINAGRHEEALYCLRRIWRRNSGEGDKYPVKNIVLDEEGNDRRTDVSFLRSLWDQIVPLFKPPLLWRSLQLYFCLGVVFGTNNSYFIWFPYLAEKFMTGLDSGINDDEKGVCNIILSNQNDTLTATVCTSKVEISLFWASLLQGASFVVLMLIVMKLASRKKMLQITILTFAGLSAVGAGVIRDNMISAIMFLCFLANELCIGIVYTYIVDLYPTSYRGMASCLSVIVARLSALACVNILGAFVLTNCTEMFYVCGGLMFIAAMLSLMLPPDRMRKT